MSEPITEARLTSAEREVDDEFVFAAGEEPLVEVELLVEDLSTAGMSLAC
jgi:hypothetical protein